MNKFTILEELEGIEEFCKQYLQKQGYTISRPETKVEVKSYLKIPKLSKEAFDKIEEIDNTPLTEKEKQSIKEFKEKVDKFYGTMEDKEWIHEKCGTNTPPTTVPKHPSKGNKLYSQDEIREKLNPGWKTRREKYSDIIELIEKIVDHKIQQFVLNEKIRKTDREVFVKISKEINNQFERWLDEDICSTPQMTK